MHAAFAAIGRFSVRFRWLVLIIWVAGAVVTTTFLPSLASVTQSETTDFLPSSSPSMRAMQLATPFQQASTIPVTVVVSRAHGELTAADQTAIGELEKAIKGTPGVVAVRDAGRSSDGGAEQLQSVANPTGGMSAEQTLVTDLRSSISGVPLPNGLEAHLAGALATAVDNQGMSAATSNKVEYLSTLFIIVLLILVFRALLAPLVTLAPAALVVSMAGPLVAQAAHAGLKVSFLAQLMMVVLVLGAGTDYGLFLVFRVREEMRAGLASKDAVVRSVARVGESITFSAGTVIAALLSLLAASFGMYADLGVPLAIGIGLMLLAGLTLLPALLAIFGKALFWPSKVKPGTHRPGAWSRISARIVRRPAITLVTGLVVFGGLAVASFGYQAAGFGGDNAPPAGSDSAAGNAALAAHFPSTSASPTSVLFQLPKPVWNEPNVLATATDGLKASKNFNTVAGALNPTGAVALSPAQLVQLHQALGPAEALPATPPAGSTVSPQAYQLYRATSEYISADGKTVQFLVGLTAGDPGGTPALHAVPGIRADVTAVAASIGATDNGVAGQAAALYDVSDTSNSDLWTVVPIAIIVIGLLLALVMRSVVAPLYLIISVGVSYLAALGFSVLLFIDILGDGGLTFILPFLMFLFLLALGEDYNILVMTRIREEAHKVSLREAVSRALQATGTTVTSAGLVLAGTFAVFAIAGGGSGSTQFRDIGFGIAVGVLMDTFLVRTLLVPSTVLLLGRWNWWPSKLARRDQVISDPEPEAVTSGGPVR